jgi:tRNA nucleotidyltransferase (CCA-adding enzyme)
VVTTTSRPGLVNVTPALEVVLEAIASTGGRPLLVGGCVRDAVLSPGTTPKDIDIEVYGVTDPEVLKRALKRVASLSEVGKSFGVLLVTRDGEDFDVSVPRRDSKTGDGHRDFAVDLEPELDFTTASGRRDFTVNAMMYDPFTGELIDCWDGLADLEARVLRHPTSAFTDDPLRVLRGVRFAGRFRMVLAPETAALCRSISDQYSRVSSERVWKEFSGLVEKGVSMSHALKALEDTGWVEHFPELAATRGVLQDPQWHPEGDVFCHLGLSSDKALEVADQAGLTGDDRAVVVLGALVHDFGKVTSTQVAPDGRITSHGHAEDGVEPARFFLERLKTPSDVLNRVLPIVREHMCTASAPDGPTRSAVRRLARRLAPASIEEWAMVCTADKGGRGAGSKSSGTGPWLELAKEVGVGREPEPLLLKGEALMEMGHKPGPQFKLVMAAALEAQDADEFSDEAGAREWLAELTRSGRLEELLEEGRRLAQELVAAKAAQREALRVANRAAKAARTKT